MEGDVRAGSRNQVALRILRHRPQAQAAAGIMSRRVTWRHFSTAEKWRHQSPALIYNGFSILSCRLLLVKWPSLYTYKAKWHSQIGRAVLYNNNILAHFEEKAFARHRSGFFHPKRGMLFLVNLASFLKILSWG